MFRGSRFTILSRLQKNIVVITADKNVLPLYRMLQRLLNAVAVASSTMAKEGITIKEGRGKKLLQATMPNREVMERSLIPAVPKPKRSKKSIRPQLPHVQFFDTTEALLSRPTRPTKAPKPVAEHPPISSAVEKLRGVEAATKSRNEARSKPATGGAGTPAGREYDEEYASYVKERTRKGSEAVATRKLIADKAKDPLNQMARLLKHSYVDYLDEDYTPVSYEDFHSEKMKEKARKAAADAAKPARYRMLLDLLIKKVEAKEAEAAKGPDAPERVIEIPAGANLKALQDLARKYNIKGFSGKSAADVRALIVKDNEGRAAREVNIHEYRVQKATENRANLTFLIEAHGKSEEELTRLIEKFRKEHSEQQARKLETIRTIQRDLNNKKITLTEAKELVEKQNKITSAYNEANQSIHSILKDALKFKQTGTSRILEESPSYVNLMF